MFPFSGASSISLAVVFTVFTDYLADATVKGILPTVILLVVMLLAVISIACQPKSQELSPFKVTFFFFLNFEIFTTYFSPLIQNY